MDSHVCVSYLMQLSQSRLPVFSLMVLSETKAGYSVSHGTCMVRPILWAGGRKEVEIDREVNSDVNYLFKIKCTFKKKNFAPRFDQS